MDYSSPYPDRLNVRLPPHWLQALQISAQNQGVSVADLVRRALDDAFWLRERAFAEQTRIRIDASVLYQADKTKGSSDFDAAAPERYAPWLEE